MKLGLRSRALLAVAATTCLCLGVVTMLWPRAGKGPDRQRVAPSHHGVDDPSHNVASHRTDADAPASLLEKLEESVAANDWEEATALEAKLAAAGESAVPALKSVLGSGRDDGTETSVELRQRAAWILGEIGTPVTVAALIDAMKREPEDEVRGQIILALAGTPAGTGRSVRTVLETTLLSTSEDAELRSSAALLLAKRPEPEATELLVRSARQRDDPEAARWAAEALGFASHREPASTLLRKTLVEDDDARLRAAAAISLARLEGVASLDTLKEQLRSDESPEVRREIVRVLGEIAASPDARGALGRVMIEDKDQGVRALAARELGRTHADDVLPVLERALSTETSLYVRTKIVEAVGRMGGNEARTILQRIAEEGESAALRGAARAALQKTDDEEF